MLYRWKAPLIGDAFDLDAMANDLKGSDTKIIKNNETYCLVANQLDTIAESNNAFAAIDEIINEINLAYHVSLPDFHPVKSADIIIEQHSDGSEMKFFRAHMHLSGLRMRASIDAFGGSSD